MTLATPRKHRLGFNPRFLSSHRIRLRDSLRLPERLRLGRVLRILDKLSCLERSVLHGGTQLSGRIRSSPPLLPHQRGHASQRIGRDSGFFAQTPAHHCGPLTDSRSFLSWAAVFLFAALALTGCVKEEAESILDEDREVLAKLMEEVPPSPERKDFPENWTIQSANGEVLARQSTKDGEVCKLMVWKRSSQEVLWESSGCLATREKLRLLSSSGEELMVLFPKPAIEVMPLGDVEVGFLASKGEIVRRFLAREFLDPASLRVGDETLPWLELRNGEPIIQHRNSWVELNLVTTQQATVDFQGNIHLSEVQQHERLDQRDDPWPEVCPPSSPCTYVDADGVFHMVESGTLVPREYWSRAKPIDGPVTEVGTALKSGNLPPVYDDPDELEAPPSPRIFNARRGAGARGASAREVEGPGGDGRQQGSNSGAPLAGETVFDRAMRLGTRAGAPLPERPSAQDAPQEEVPEAPPEPTRRPASGWGSSEAVIK